MLSNYHRDKSFEHLSLLAFLKPVFGSKINSTMLPIVDYESSDSESDTETRSAHLVAMPALPTFFSPGQYSTRKCNDPFLTQVADGLFCETASSSRDDPAKHQGRVRTKPHTVNSWATHVYFEIPGGSEIRRIIEHVTAADKRIHGMDYSDGSPENLLHVSLSRCIFLKEHQLDSFARAVCEEVADCPSVSIAFAMVSVLTNDEKTRSFITAEIGSGYDQLLSILQSVDRVMERFRQPIFYKPPRFHASIAWSLEPEPLEAAVGTIPAEMLDELTADSHTISSLIVKMGKRIVRMPLRPKAGS
ncbi:hypothetical protein BX666DRAFT_968559 [Dichotomocladium elegans]|nr:hypothetical protein BX666DRAFT_968559 [Dichotomocladium elegans]